jgi:hyaluronan synthase
LFSLHTLNRPEIDDMAQPMRLDDVSTGSDIRESIDSIPRATVVDWVLRGSILLGLAFVVYATIVGRLFHPLLRAAGTESWGRVIIRPSLLWAMMGALLLVYRTTVWFMYRPFASASFEYAPSMSVIIPAYNEGAMVRKSIDSAAAALYRRDRLEIFVIDDGSTMTRGRT